MKSRLATFFFFCIVVALFFLSVPLWASGDCKGNQPCNTDGGDTNINIGDTRVGATTVTNDVTTGDVVGGDTSFDSKALALSNSLGDVDIAGCLGSTQWSTPLFSKQKLVVNWPCLTEFYLRNGKYELAAMAICNTEIVKEFASEAECEAAHDFEQIIEEPVIVMESNNDDEVEYLRNELEEQAMLQADLNAKIENLKNSQRVVIQKPFLSEKQRQALQEVQE